MTEETKIPKSISRYFSDLARKANSKQVRGSEEAKARTGKARGVLKAKRAERKADASRAKLENG